ncbi:hypothetical protein O1M63_18805 [Streptomyces mirabilis]|nr:hypothetical protein [Streptomyces mirabilis]
MKMTPAMRAWISAACAVPLLLAGGGAATAQPPAGQTPTAVQKAAPLDENLVGVWRGDPPTNAGSNTIVRYIEALRLTRNGDFFLVYNYRCPEPPTPCPMFELAPIRGRYTVTALSDNSGTLTLTSGIGGQVVVAFRFGSNGTLILNDGGNDQPLHRVRCPAAALFLPHLCFLGLELGPLGEVLGLGVHQDSGSR